MEKLTPQDLLGPLNDVEQKYAPKMLYIAGDRGLIKAAPRVAVIGSRKASSEGRQRAAAISKALVSEGITIVSGLAEGIDTAAHESAIRSNGRTIAVLGTPLDKVFPAKNRALQDEIMRLHLAISQYPSGASIQSKFFVLRNRTMALISHASIIVEAGESSGSLSQGWETLRLGRTLFLDESLAANPRLTWAKELIEYGARVLSQVEDVLEVLPATGASLDVDAAF